MFAKKESKLWTFVAFLLIVIPMYFAVKNFRDIESVVLRAGIAGPLVMIALYGIFAATPVSTDPLTLISSVVFGPLIGIAVSWTGNNVAALVEYYVGAHLGRATNMRALRKKLPFGLGKLPLGSPWVLIFGRLVPGFGGKIISILAGIYHVPIRSYLWTTAITNLIGSVLLSLGGYKIIHLLK